LRKISVANDLLKSRQTSNANVEAQLFRISGGTPSRLRSLLLSNSNNVRILNLRNSKLKHTKRRLVFHKIRPGTQRNPCTICIRYLNKFLKKSQISCVPDADLSLKRTQKKLHGSVLMASLMPMVRTPIMLLIFRSIMHLMQENHPEVVHSHNR
jgi:hypothetical protein